VRDEFDGFDGGLVRFSPPISCDLSARRLLVVDLPDLGECLYTLRLSVGLVEVLS
jgi:hypothetical protein